MNEFTLRIELKITKTKGVKIIGLKTFTDVNQYTLNSAEQLLLRQFEVVRND